MLTVTINNEVHRIDADPDMPILWVLRDILNKTGTKFGCGKGLCGACTVLLGKEAIRSCITPISAAENKSITTIEGLSDKGDHPLQKAWIAKNVPQCGYCQPGQIMNAAGLLHNNPEPSRDDVRQHMAGNICRCGTYQRIEQAILLAAKSSKANGKGGQ
ncbi:MAG: (2Fe-2S)-binding protein [Deltaproteobacteria bacterium]|nr:MAG: (2Fe-2S)-binding protein [Deltaproteobacteria bacterium]